MDIIKVRGTSRTSAVAGAIAGVFRDNKLAEVQAIGASAVNQAVKALALSRSYLAQDGIDVVFMKQVRGFPVRGSLGHVIVGPVLEPCMFRITAQNDLAIGRL